MKSDQISQKQRILLVDDEHLGRKLFSQLLSIYDYDVITAKNGEEALKLAYHEQVDCILLDISMAGMDGFEVCLILKNEPKTASIPVVMLSALNDTNSMIKSYERGANGFLSKPIGIEKIVEEIRNVTSAGKKLPSSQDRVAD